MIMKIKFSPDNSRQGTINPFRYQFSELSGNALKKGNVDGGRHPGEKVRQAFPQ